MDEEKTKRNINHWGLWWVPDRCYTIKKKTYYLCMSSLMSNIHMKRQEEISQIEMLNPITYLKNKAILLKSFVYIYIVLYVTGSWNLHLCVQFANVHPLRGFVSW